MKIFKKQIITIIALIFFIFSNTGFVFAMTSTERLGAVGSTAGYKQSSTEGADLPTYIGNIIQAVLSLLGVIFLALLVYGGFRWMQARGSDDEVSTAKEIMINATIGLVITLMSYGVTFYIVSKMASATLQGGGGFK